MHRVTGRIAVGFVIAVACLSLIVAAGEKKKKNTWETVTVFLEEPDGGTLEVQGTAISYAYYVREFSPKGVKDKLQVKKHLIFPDKNIRFPDLDRIEFELGLDTQTQVKEPTSMTIYYREKRGEVVELEREVSMLRGFEHPKPVMLIVTTDDGEVELDLTPAHDETEREDYLPIVKVQFE